MFNSNFQHFEYFPHESHPGNRKPESAVHDDLTEPPVLDKSWEGHHRLKAWSIDRSYQQYLEQIKKENRERIQLFARDEN